MSYIEPNTNITVYRNTGLSPHYDNTLYFESEDAKDLYWAGASEYIAGTFNKCYYQRTNKNTIRLEAPIRQLYKCDYMRFKNLSYENKFYYAFVTAVNYVNNETTELEFVIDPIMTWMGTFVPKKCLVLRQHARRDRIGDSLTDEGVQLGDYIITHVDAYPASIGYSETRIIIWVADETHSGEMSGGVYSGAKSIICADADSANAEIDKLVANNQAENIISIMMIPAYLATSENGIYSYEYGMTKGYTNFDGYVPRNNKLFTYPYHKIVASNNAGAEQTYRPEFFTKTLENIVFEVYATLNTSVQMMLIPKNYKGTGSNIEEALTMPDFPLCSWNYDSYKAWLAQYNAYYPQSVDLLENQLQSRTAKVSADAGINALTGTVSGALKGLIAGGPLGAVGGGVSGALTGAVSGLSNIGKNAADNAVDMETKSRESMIYNSSVPTTPQVLKGKVTPQALFAQGAGLSFRIYDKKITAQYAQSIDDYFTLYGYTLNQVETPSMNNRQYYTYVKTSGCNIGGELPADDARQIEDIFDSGIRFWKRLGDIGNYDLVNSPLET